MWTRKGQLFAAGGAALVLAGVVLNAPIILLAGLFPWATVAVAAVVRVKHSLARASKKKHGARKADGTGLEIERELSASSALEGDEVDVKLKISNLSRTMKRLMVRDALSDRMRVKSGTNYGSMMLPPRGIRELNYRVWAPVKGVHELGPVTIRSSDIADIFFDEYILENRSSLMVHPKAIPAKGLPVRSKVPKLYAGSTIINRRGQGTEFYSLRDYVVGDNYKDINWTAYARTRRLMVNEHTMEAVVEVTIILDYRAISAAGPVMDAVDVVSARACTSISDAFLRRRDRVGVVVYNDSIHTLGCDGGQKQMRKVRDLVSGHDVKGDLGLGPVVGGILHTIRKGTPVVLISSLLDDPTAQEALERLRALSCDVILISPHIGGGEGIEFLAQERRAALEEAASLGVRVVDWDIGMPLAEALAGGGSLAR